MPQQGQESFIGISGFTFLFEQTAPLIQGPQKDDSAMQGCSSLAFRLRADVSWNFGAVSMLSLLPGSSRPNLAWWPHHIMCGGAFLRCSVTLSFLALVSGIASAQSRRRRSPSLLYSSAAKARPVPTKPRSQRTAARCRANVLVAFSQGWQLLHQCNDPFAGHFAPA